LAYCWNNGCNFRPGLFCSSLFIVKSNQLICILLVSGAPITINPRSPAMKMLTRLFLYLSLMVLFFHLSYSGTYRVDAASVLYVSPTGNDSSACNLATAPCASINAAINKSLPGDTIKISLGTYKSTGEQVVLITKNINLLGGWNSSFTSQTGRSVLDGENARRVVKVNDEAQVLLQRFTVENGRPSEGGAGILNEGVLTIDRSLIRNNTGGDNCWGGGIANYGTLTLESSTLSNNTCTNWGMGGGIYSWPLGGPLTISNSTVENNRANIGGGVYAAVVPFSLTNSTISENFAGYGFSNSGGGGLHLEQVVGKINNSTIVNNDGGASGGGIFFNNFYGGNLILQNTILADNIANQHLDCFGQIESAGYNILGSTTGCSFASISSDKINMDPMVAPLDSNGGPTKTHTLYNGSPAIDSGNPAGCSDSSGVLLAVDQRGLPRLADGDSDGTSVCDIGAIEAVPGELVPAPGTTWFVSPLGNDTGNCLSATTPCATIPAALAKADPGDTILVATGYYSSNTAHEVVLVDRDIILSGGWRNDFTSRNGFTTIDGSQARRGITILEDIIADFSRLNIQNGLAIDEDGGGMYIGFRARVNLEDSIIHENRSQISEGLGLPREANGGGIAMNNYAHVTITRCVVINNNTRGFGGGIYSGGSNLTVNDSLIGGNIGAGGISNGFGGEIEINNSAVIYNSDGGGIRADVLRIKNSLVRYNRTSELGGGILSKELLDVEDSVIYGNQASSGGGIYSWYQASIRNSSVIFNRATYGNGGGIHSAGNIDISNSTISYNRAEMPFSDDAEGGGIKSVGGSLNIYSATIFGNRADRGGGIFYPGEMYLRNTILAVNQALTGPDCYGTVRSEGYNLIGKTQNCDYHSAPGDQLNIDPKIGYPFGWPRAISLRPESPAIDAGNPAGCTDHLDNPISKDQLGNPRAVDGDGIEGAYCDIGAFEFDLLHPIEALFLPFASKMPAE
jgi:hypothetical protein